MSCLAFQPPSGLALVPLVTMAALMVVGLANARQRQFFGKDYFLLTHAAMIVWLGALSLEMLTTQMACRPMFSAIAYVGIAPLPVVWVMFIYHYAFSLARRPGVGELLLILGFGAGMALFALTNDSHGLMYSHIGPAVNANGDVYVEYRHAIGFFVFAGVIYTILSTAMVMLVMGLVRAAPQFRLYFAYPALITAIVFVPNIAYVAFDVHFFGFDGTPFAFAVVVMLFSLLIVSNRVFDVVNVGSDLIFANLRHPALIVDAEGQVIAANANAVSAFPVLRGRPNRPVTELAELAPAMSFATGALRIVPGRRILVGERFFDVEGIAIPKPLSRREEPIGMVVMLSDVTAEEQRYRELEAELASNMRQLETSAAMQAALREAAEFDPLTRVRNRLSLPGLFGHCIEQASREQKRLVVALFDIDHFKRWNDVHGHAAGDRVLKDFARFLEEHFMAVEPVFRIGGEEFLVLLPDTDRAAARARIEALQARLARADFQRADDASRVTFSAGLAQWPEDGVSLEGLLETADRRLYGAKASGRNRVVAA